MRIPNSGLLLDDPAFPLLQAGISYWGTTTAAGATTGDTIVCAGLLTESSYDGLTVKLLSGLAAGQVRLIAHHPAPSNTLTTDKPFTDAAGGIVTVAAGTLFVILSSASGGGGTPPSAEAEGLYYSGTVGAVPAANQFTIAALAGLGAGKFADATAPYRAFVVRDAGGAAAAPQGQMRAITGYTTGTGNFTAPGFAPAVAVGDEILIVHPRLAEIADILAAVLAVAHTFQEQADTAVNINAIAAGETNVLNLAVAGTRYIVRHLRLKCANPGANTCTVRLYELQNDALTLVDSFDINAANFATSHSLMDCFGVPYLAGDQLQVTVQMSAGGAIAITGQMSWASAT